MSIQTHVKSLNQKHAAIEDVISREELRPQPDNIKLMSLKKQKLQLKEELSKLIPNS
jgi:hypothetical protein